MRLGIIDIGYNAIRAVVYADNSLGAPEIFNNKFKNDILALLANDDIDVKHQSYLSLQYIVHIFERLEVKTIKCVATAVLREHPRAADFVKIIQEKFNFHIEVISGDREAHLSALGLISGINGAKGIAADLGGGSLELVEVNDNKVGNLVSLPLGTKIIHDHHTHNLGSLTEIIDKECSSRNYESLYLIGGALRFISRFFIEFSSYPIKNLHNLEIPIDEFSYYLDKIQNNPQQASKIGKRKISYGAILVAKAMISVFKPKSVVVSTFGLKEGVRFEALASEERGKNIVHEKVKHRCHYNESKTDFDSYLKVIQPLIQSTEGTKELLTLSIMLSSLNKDFDQTLPPKAISESILSSEIPFTHKLRVMLALVLSYSSNFNPDPYILKISRKLLTKEEHNNSQIIAHFIRIAKDIDGPIFTSPTFGIEMKNHYLEIVSKDILPRPIFEKICERLKSIAFARKMNSNW